MGFEERYMLEMEKIAAKATIVFKTGKKAFKGFKTGASGGLKGYKPGSHTRSLRQPAPSLKPVKSNLGYSTTVRSVS